MISYDDRTHTYSYRGKRYISATQLLDYVVPKFDVEKHALRMSEEHGHTPEYWKAKWRKETERSIEGGNLFHAQKELLTESQGFERTGNGELLKVRNQDLMSLATYDYSAWLDGVYPELKLWNHSWRIAGRADKVIMRTVRHIRYADIDDYKTNKRIRTTGWYDPLTGTYEMLKAPLDHLQNCEWSKYALQFSLYQFMLEQMGFHPGERRMLHHPPCPFPDLVDDPNARSKKPVIQKLPYLYDEVQALLSYTWKLRNI